MWTEDTEVYAVNHSKNRKLAITFRWQPKDLQVASERTTMEEAVPNWNILVSKFRLLYAFLQRIKKQVYRSSVKKGKIIDYYQL